ncbi:class I SAM-dependent methyltransferase [Altererythrobacter sp. KTW20L]|uniref:class I SAM-dependent methyltransferase n=1 Tax=Altererythrobacter sp. KTW20L TaxID=2942210 RepID=UPI0020BD7291|nr:class I SAM-dependent methyltransferase [Altererythrobacter sp. KTW20L]MCL6249532.1 class I SAM-dependent methyltransferase [Altererythrobacter sp. KTW20L]
MALTVKSPETVYTGDFHAGRDARTRHAARKILGLMREWTGAESLVDIGCGVGSWLAAAQETGFTHCRGVEGPWGRDAALAIDPAIVTFQDLQQPIQLDRRFDLALTLEVAEHLPETRANSFVADLCALADLVLFSAAIPMQGGKGHVNEQWQSYWAELFAEHGYQAFDPIRPLLWNDPDISFWYRQNTLIYAKSGSAAFSQLMGQGFSEPVFVDLVHPEQYEFAESAQPRRAIGRKVKDLLRIP